MLGENTAVSASADGGVRGAPAVLRDRYVLERRLEQGRLGTMHRALDRLRSHGGRAHVGVLILPRDIASDPARLAAYHREFANVSALSHSNVVELYDIDRDGDTHFVVLEWIDGESLRSIIDTLAPETVCESDALGVVRAVGSALVYAHAKGVVHGDVRPENVVVTERGEVMLHFASACLAQSAPFAVVPRDDVRGLAALAYELVTGAPPPAGGLYGRAGTTDEAPPVDGLGRKRWKALKSALSLRDGRIATVRQLLAALDLAPVPPPSRGRPRRGRRSDLRPAGRVRRFAALAVLAAAAVGVFGVLRWASERSPDTFELAAWPDRLSAGLDRAAERAIAGLAGARDGVERASGAVGAWWEGRSADEVAPRTSGSDSREDGGGPSNADSPSGGSAPRVPEPDPMAPARPGGSFPVAGPIDRGGDGETAGSETASAEAAGAGTGNAEPDAAESAGEPAADEPVSEGVVAEEAAADGTAEEGARPIGSDADDPPARQTEPTAANVVYFPAPEVSVAESGGVAAIEVRRPDARGALSFVWWTRDGTAVAGEDYADLGRVVERFADGEMARTIYVPIVSDAVREDRRERFEVLVGTLSTQGNQNGAVESIRVTIVDDD